MASEKEADPNQRNSESYGQERVSSKRLRGLQGKQSFLWNARFQDRIKTWVGLAKQFLQPGIRMTPLPSKPHEELLRWWKDSKLLQKESVEPRFELAPRECYTNWADWEKIN